MAVSRYVPILLAVLMCVGCHEYSTSNVMENSMKLMGMPGIPLQFCLTDGKKSSVACMDATPLNLDDRNVSCPAWSVKHNGSSKCECGSDLHGKVTCCQNLEKLLIFHCFCVTYDSTTDRVIAGGCMYTCPYGLFYVVTSNQTELTAAVCTLQDSEIVLHNLKFV